MGVFVWVLKGNEEYEGDFLKEDVRREQIYNSTSFGRTLSLHALRGKLPYKIRFFSPPNPQELLGKRNFGVAFAHPKVFLYPHGDPVSLRFGHARGLTPHCGVIQDPHAASLPHSCHGERKSLPLKEKSPRGLTGGFAPCQPYTA